MYFYGRFPLRFAQIAVSSSDVSFHCRFAFRPWLVVVVVSCASVLNIICHFFSFFYLFFYVIEENITIIKFNVYVSLTYSQFSSPSPIYIIYILCVRPDHTPFGHCLKYFRRVVLFCKLIIMLHWIETRRRYPSVPFRALTPQTVSYLNAR